MKISKKIYLLVLSIVFLSINMTTIVMAATGPGGRDYNHGYFYNGGPFLSNYDHVLSDGGLTGYTDSKAAFIARIENLYNSGSAQDKTGAAFIVQTMRGSPYNYSKTLSSDDIADWEGRILSSSVTLGVENYTYDWNSGYIASADDDAYLWLPDTQPSLIFRVDGVIKFAIKINCGNPVGDLPGPPPVPLVSWSLSATSVVQGISGESGIDTAKPGETITWTHQVTNGGPNPTDKTITYYWQNDTGTDHGPHTDIPASPGLPANGSVPAWTSSYQVQSSDIGKNICRETTASPSSSFSDSPTNSRLACVHISSPDAVYSVCRPIKVTIGNPPYDVHYQRTVPITVQAVSSTGASIYIGTYSTSTTIDVTPQCTTGDVWTIQERTSSYIYYHYDYYVPCGSALAPAVCGPYHQDFWTTYSRNTTVGPCYNYKLTAIINSFSNRVEPDAIINISPSVNSNSFISTIPGINPGTTTNVPHTKSKSSKWQITKMIVPPNVSVPIYKSDSDSSLTPCNYFDPGGVSACTSQLDNGATVFSVGGTPSVNMSSTYIVPDIAAGTKICFAFSVYPSQSDPLNYSSSPSPSDQWNHATFDPANNCVIVVKKPKVQIWGGDIWSNKSIDTSTSTKNMGGVGRTFGSWVEYGIFATGTVSGMASGSAFYGLGLANADISGCNYSILTFTNAGSSTCGLGTVKGNYQNAKTIPDIAASFPSAGITIIANSIVPNDLLATSGTYVGTRNGDLTLTQSNLSPGKSIILKVSGTVTIAGNQTYNPDNNGLKYNNVSQLPQLVIIANRIVINGNVTNVDAWLVAKNNSNNGSIYTCDVEGKTINDCKNPLTVNGPVTTDKIYLRRTAGSGTDVHSGDPAEVFNLRADAYLWAYAQAKSSSRVQTVYTTELPPRF